MTNWRWALALVVLLSGCSGQRPATTATAPGASGNAPGADLTALRRQAALEPCPPGISTALPDRSLACIGGGPAVRVKAAPGRAHLVNFYNTACGPCQDEFPVLRSYAATAGATPLLGVDAEDSPTAELAFLRDFKAHWPAVSDPQGELFRTFAGGWPVTVAVRADGSVAASHTGPFRSVGQLQTFARVLQR